MTEQEGRQAVVREARTWRQTPFQWECALKGVGVDCGRFLACVYNNAHIKQIDIAAFDYLPPNWFLHKESGSFLKQVEKYAVRYELAPGESPKSADIVIVKCGRDWAHSAIVVEWPRIIGSASGFVVTEWQNFYTSPQFGNREWVVLNPWAEGAGGNISA